MVANTKKLNKIIKCKPKYLSLKKMLISEFKWKEKISN